MIVNYAYNKHPYLTEAHFSTDDYGNGSKENIGIVFPFTEGDNTPVFSSIFRHHNDRAYCARTEYYLADSIDKDTIQYSRSNQITVVYSPSITINPSKALYSFTRTTPYTIDDKYIVTDFVENIDSFNTISNEIFQLLSELDFTPEFLIDSSNISPKAVKKDIKEYEEIDFYSEDKKYKDIDYKLIFDMSDDDIAKLSDKELQDRLEEDTYPLIFDLANGYCDDNLYYKIVNLSKLISSGNLPRKQMLHIIADIKAALDNYYDEYCDL